MCDKMLIRRVLANLVENAIQAAGEASARARGADRRSATREGAAVLTVDDNGPGVTADARERIFDPYITTKEHGTGLGLAIVRKIVLDHGGDVNVAGERSPLGGARLGGHLPTAAARPPQPDSVSLRRSADAPPIADVGQARLPAAPPRDLGRATIPSAPAASACCGSRRSSLPSDSASQTWPSPSTRAARATSGVSSTSR